MSHTNEVRYTSQDVSPPSRHSKSRSPLKNRSRSRSRDPSNPGNNLYITGLSIRVTSEDLEKHFCKEGKVTECQVVLDPHTKVSRGFAFVTMETVEDANRCIKYLNDSVLEGRLMTVEKAKRRRRRTPTPGKFQGPRGKYLIKPTGRERKRSRSTSPDQRRRERGRSRSRDRRERSHSPRDRRERRPKEHARR